MDSLNLSLFEDSPAAGDTGAHAAEELVVDRSAPSAAEVQRRAEELYNNSQLVRPTWSQLGEVTKSVWLEYALRDLQGDPEPFRQFPRSR